MGQDPQAHLLTQRPFEDNLEILTPACCDTCASRSTTEKEVQKVKEPRTHFKKKNGGVEGEVGEHNHADVTFQKS